MERNLMIAGFGGQGVMTMGKLLAEATSQATDLNVTFFPSYGAAMRGGTANCYVVISDDPIGAPVSYSLEDLVVMNGPSLHQFLPNLKPGGNLFVNSTIVTDPIERDDINVIKARNAIKKAFRYQLEGKGYSIVEIVTSCPTNWGLDPLKSLDFLREKMFAEYPLGVFRDGGEKKQ